MSVDYLYRETVDIPRVGSVNLREFSWPEAVAHDELLREAENPVERFSALCKSVAPLVEEPKAFREALESAAAGGRGLPLEVFDALIREVYKLSKIDVPELEILDEGEEYVSHVEDSAEDF